MPQSEAGRPVTRRQGRIQRGSSKSDPTWCLRQIAKQRASRVVRGSNECDSRTRFTPISVMAMTGSVAAFL